MTLADELAPLVDLALGCVGRDTPHVLVHRMPGEEKRAVRELTPAFYGCYDWHSAVHSHWLLARATRQAPDAPFVTKARAALSRSLSPENLAVEFRYLEAREDFERPYGLAWLLVLARELALLEDEEGRGFSKALLPLASLGRDRMRAWMAGLLVPNRSGAHDQTAFCLGLVLDSAPDLVGEAGSRARALFAADRDAPLHLEPHGNDFLSPTLAVADVMRRVLAPGAFAEWLGTFLPDVPRDGRSELLTPVRNPDPSDYKRSHLDGLNLSRAWMLEGIAGALPADDDRVPFLRAAARRHGEAGLSATKGDHYAGAHWLGSYAVYWLGRREGLG